MNDWIHYLSLPIILLALRLLVINFKKGKEKEIIKNSKKFFNVGLFGTIIGSVIAFLLGLFPAEESKEYVWIVVLIFLGFAMLGIVLMIWYLNFKIEFDKDDLIHTDFFKKVNTYKISELNYDQNLLKLDIYKKDEIVLRLNESMLNIEIIKDELDIRKYDKNSIGIIKGNIIAKRLGIVVIVSSIAVMSIFILLLFYGENNAEILTAYIFLVILAIYLGFGIYLVLFGSFFKIHIDETDVSITNIFGRTKTYTKKELKNKPTVNGCKIYYNNVKILYFINSFVDDSKLTASFDNIK